MIDNKGKLFGKISVVDIIIVLAFAIAIGGFVYKLTSGDETIAIQNDTPISITFQVKNVRKVSVDAVEVGQNFYEEHGDVIGKVTAVSSQPANLFGDNGDGTQTYGEVEGRYDAYITIAAMGKVNENGYYINGSKQLAKGSNLKLESNTISCSGYVDSIS